MVTAAARRMVKVGNAHGGLSILPSITSNMAAVGIPAIMIRSGDEGVFDNNAGSYPADRGNSIPGRPRHPSSPTPTRSEGPVEPEPDQEAAPEGIPQEENAPADERVAEIVGSDKGNQPAGPPGEDDADTIQENGNEWMRYSVPPALSSVPEELAQTVLEIVRTSVENVDARVAEAEARRRQQEEEEARRRAEDEEAEAQRKKEKSKGKQKEIDYFPIIIPDPEAEKKRQEEEWARRRQAAWSGNAGFDSTGSINGADRKDRGHKRHKYSMSRILGGLGGDDKRESSRSNAANGMRRKGAEATAANALDNRDAILRQLGSGDPKGPDRKSNELSRARPLSETSPRDVDPRLSQLRVATALLQKNSGNSDHRLSTVGSVRRRVKGKVQQKIGESAASGSDGETEPKNEVGDGATIRSKDGQAESQSDGDSTAHE